MNRYFAAWMVTACVASIPGIPAAEAQIRIDPAVDYTVALSPAGVALGDFNGDRRADMAVTADTPDRVVIFTNTGSGAFGAPVNVPLAGGSGPDALVAGDVDNDDDLDLVVIRSNENDVQILVNAGGVFTLGAITSVAGTRPRHLAVADLDGNGFLDVVTSNRDSNDLSVMLNSGGALGAAMTYPVGADPRGLALADFDGDLLLDIAVASQDTRAVDLLLNLPASPGVFADGPSLSVGPQLRPDGVAAADLDGDGDFDIATATSGTNLNFATVFLNLGSAAFAAAASYPTGGVDPSGIAAADLDFDGDRDLAVSNQGSANVSLLANVGTGVFGAPSLLAAGTTPEILAAEDLDSNGATDLVTVNRDANSVSVFLNRSVLFANGFESGDASSWSSAVP